MNIVIFNMKKITILFSVFLLPFISNAQISKAGYKDFKWGQLESATKGLMNCNSKLSGSEFTNCDITSKDSLFYKNFKYQFCNVRFFKGKLCEIQFDLNHADIASIIASFTQQFGKPIIKEKKHKALDEENQSTGYQWKVGDTEIFMINDGRRMPAICILSSISAKINYPANTLDLEKLIFE